MVVSQACSNFPEEPLFAERVQSNILTLRRAKNLCGTVEIRNSSQATRHSPRYEVPKITGSG